LCLTLPPLGFEFGFTFSTLLNETLSSEEVHISE
jgi:hypothetical protein